MEYKARIAWSTNDAFLIYCTNSFFCIGGIHTHFIVENEPSNTIHTNNLLSEQEAWAIVVWELSIALCYIIKLIIYFPSWTSIASLPSEKSFTWLTFYGNNLLSFLSKDAIISNIVALIIRACCEATGFVKLKIRQAFSAACRNIKIFNTINAESKVICI